MAEAMRILNKFICILHKTISILHKKKKKKAIADYKESIKLTCKYSLANYDEENPFYGKAKTFYKFCPINKNTLALLIKQEIYFSNIASLNDPLECPFVQEEPFFRNTVFAKGTNYEPRILSLVLPYDNPKKCKKLSKELPVKNCLLFFSHYAAAHTGICIEYQITKEFLHEKMFYTKVSYQDTNLVQSISDLFALKNKQWEYEHEARFVAFGKKDLYCYTKKEVTISKIIFGCKTSNKDKQLLCEIMKGQGIKFFEAKEAGETLLNVKFESYPKEENRK